MNEDIEYIGRLKGNYYLANAVYGINAIAPCMTSAMGMGGGFIPYILLTNE